MSAKRTELWRAIKYTLLSFTAGALSLGSFWLFTQVWDWNAELAQLVSLTLSVVWSFTVNRKLTFRSTANVPIAMLKLAAFYVVFTPLSIWLTAELVGIGWHEMIVKLITQTANLILEYFYMRYVVFRNSIDTAEETKKDV